MPHRLSSEQIRGARAMLGWSMVRLAIGAQVSVSTVKRVESDTPGTVSDDTFGLIRDALETAGVQFLSDDGDGSGMRLRRR